MLSLFSFQCSSLLSLVRSFSPLSLFSFFFSTFPRIYSCLFIYFFYFSLICKRPLENDTLIFCFPLRNCLQWHLRSQYKNHWNNFISFRTSPSFVFHIFLFIIFVQFYVEQKKTLSIKQSSNLSSTRWHDANNNYIKMKKICVFMYIRLR